MHKTQVFDVCRVISLSEELFLTISGLNKKWNMGTQFFFQKGSPSKLSQILKIHFFNKAQESNE